MWLVAGVALFLCVVAGGGPGAARREHRGQPHRWPRNQAPRCAGPADPGATNRGRGSISRSWATSRFANFFAANVAALLGLPQPHLEVIPPIGISFLPLRRSPSLSTRTTSQAEEPSLVNYALSRPISGTSPGPILHHGEMMPQFADTANKRRLRQARAPTLVAIGLAKKVLIADTLARWQNGGFEPGPPLSFADAWLTILCYTMCRSISTSAAKSRWRSAWRRADDEHPAAAELRFALSPAQQARRGAIGNTTLMRFPARL